MTALLATALLGLAVSTPANAAATVVVTNMSSYSINNLYLSSSSDPSWGEDWLGDYILSNGTTFTLSGLTCDNYDVKLIDEDGDVCELSSVPLCEDTDTWVIDDATLIGCQMASQ